MRPAHGHEDGEDLAEAWKSLFGNKRPLAIRSEFPLLARLG